MIKVAYFVIFYCLSAIALYLWVGIMTEIAGYYEKVGILRLT
jgi:hypothetical protein